MEALLVPVQKRPISRTLPAVLQLGFELGFNVGINEGWMSLPFNGVRVELRRVLVGVFRRGLVFVRKVLGKERVVVNGVAE